MKPIFNYSAPVAAALAAVLLAGGASAQGVGAAGSVDATTNANTAMPAKTSGNAQPTEPMAKPKMTTQERADRRAARKAAKTAKNKAAQTAMPADGLSLSTP